MNKYFMIIIIVYAVQMAVMFISQDSQIKRLLQKPDYEYWMEYSEEAECDSDNWDECRVRTAEIRRREIK